MSSALKRPPRDMTVEEFLEWADATEGRWQLRDGQPEAMAPPIDTHGAIQAEMVRLLGNHLERLGLPCRVNVGPGVVPGRRPESNMLVPDIGVTCAPPSALNALPEPLVVVEILSPSNVRATRLNIAAFATIPTVRDRVLLHGKRIRAEVLRRQPDGSWPEQAEIVGAEDTLRIEAIEFAAPLRAAYRTTVLA